MPFNLCPVVRCFLLGEVSIAGYQHIKSTEVKVIMLDVNRVNQQKKCFTLMDIKEIELDDVKFVLLDIMF